MSGGGEFTVRRGAPTDLPALLALVDTFTDAPGWPEHAWRRFLTQEVAFYERILLLAEDPQGELLGVLAATRLEAETELEWLLVHPQRRRRGTGRALLHAWLAWAEARDAAVALLEVRASNAPALRLYESLGFVVNGRRTAYYHDPVEDALLMAWRLQAPQSSKS